MRLWLSITHKESARLRITFEEVNGEPAVISWAGEALYDVVTFEVVDGRIKTIRGILHPGKLAYIARQLQSHPHD
jgi:RNA polymerase sigma-70 factor (ECF subfamily)